MPHPWVYMALWAAFRIIQRKENSATEAVWFLSWVNHLTAFCCALLSAYFTVNFSRTRPMSWSFHLLCTYVIGGQTHWEKKAWIYFISLNSVIVYSLRAKSEFCFLNSAERLRTDKRKSFHGREVCGWVRKIPWRRAWQPTPCLGNPKDRRALQTTVHSVAKNHSIPSWKESQNQMLPSKFSVWTWVCLFPSCLSHTYDM